MEPEGGFIAIFISGNYGRGVDWGDLLVARNLGHPHFWLCSNIAHQRGNGAGNKPTGGKPVGSQLQKGAANGKPAAQGEGKSAGKGKPAGKPAHKGKAPTRAGSAKPGAKPATQGGKPAAKGNGAKRPAR